MTLSNSPRTNAQHAERVLSFWFDEAKPHQWFRRDDRFDQTIRDRFGALHAAARAGALNVWRASPRPALAQIVLLDQFSRNIFRDDPRAFAQDAMALDAARDAVRRRFDLAFAPRQRAFIYMPFMHAEDMAAQDQSLALFKARLPVGGNLPYAVQHREIIKRFGRFPHRNAVLGRRPTAEEIAFLKTGGFNP